MRPRRSPTELGAFGHEGWRLSSILPKDNQLSSIGDARTAPGTSARCARLALNGPSPAMTIRHNDRRAFIQLLLAAGVMPVRGISLQERAGGGKPATPA